MSDCLLCIPTAAIIAATSMHSVIVRRRDASRCRGPEEAPLRGKGKGQGKGGDGTRTEDAPAMCTLHAAIAGDGCWLALLGG
jgi:hypothetical protein